MPSPSPPDLIGQSPVFLDALAHASAVAALDRPILIIGERGAGKELIAARIHFLSPRWEAPLIKVNCAAMNENLLESELFGHEAGAFTGAAKRHAGRFERAEGGTLFLDEIAASSLRVQEKLLRVIEYGEYERLGGDKTLTADVRIIGAANVDLRQLAKQGRFRADLLDRLAFDVVAAPPLRERREDIALLASHFATIMSHEIDAPYKGFSSGAMRFLRDYDWPGNVRELKNTVERSFYRWHTNERQGPVDEIILDPFPDLAAPTLEKKNLASNVAVDGPGLIKGASLAPPGPAEFITDLRKYLDETEKNIVLDALEKADGNQARAAKSLSLTYNQIRGIIRKHAIVPAN